MGWNTVLSLTIRPMELVLLSAEATGLLSLSSPLVLNPSGERFPRYSDAGSWHPNKSFPSCAPQVSHIGIVPPFSLCPPLRKVF